ncbi:hypothetical protein UFOVP55_30 [uncultured Caudovirales phage]|uniref:Uncharacterized protein n=1 Tax=uncultured Caudovirales phage TaxID=2100421 RepID=A0A6J5KU72_9CAUD|nr:hypothetical protein UFOVP55_30 [uncultured Caudovirales phage]
MDRKQLADLTYAPVPAELHDKLNKAFPEGSFVGLEFISGSIAVFRGKALKGDDTRYFAAQITPEDITDRWIWKFVGKIRKRFAK